MECTPAAVSVQPKIPFYDIIKALGIIAIVVGHCHPSVDVYHFVYSFHLALFFFMAGVQLNGQKYARQPFLLLQNRVKSLWPGFFGYLTFYTITHNLAVRIHLLQDQALYSKSTMVNNIIKNFIFRGNETLGGALWFVQILLIALMLFSVILYFSYTLFYRYRLIPIVLSSCMMGALGLICYMQKISLVMNSHASVLLLPVLLIGFLLTYFHLDYNKIFRWFIAVPCAVFSVSLTLFTSYHVELAAVIISNPILFYPATFSGIYLICYLAKLLSKNKYTAKAFSFIGKYTFDIMALHFLFFKLIDLIYGSMIGAAPETYTRFPCAYQKLWPIYLLTSILLAPLIRIALHKAYLLLKNAAQTVFGKPA